MISGNTFALYADGKTLNFQWNDRRWNVASNDFKPAYRHDFARQITVFTIGDQSIEYPAWWQNDPCFDPNLPERDEDEDYLGYICAVARNKALQSNLLNSWSS